MLMLNVDVFLPFSRAFLPFLPSPLSQFQLLHILIQTPSFAPPFLTSYPSPPPIDHPPCLFFLTLLPPLSCPLPSAPPHTGYIHAYIHPPSHKFPLIPAPRSLPLPRCREYIINNICQLFPHVLGFVVVGSAHTHQSASHSA